MTSEAEFESVSNRRSSYLHEAGHAIVGFREGLIIREVRCGSEDAAKVEFTSEQTLELNEICKGFPKGGFPTVELLTEYLSLYRPRLVTYMGGIAGQNLILGRPMNVIRNAGDDIGSFFSILSIAASNFPAPFIHKLFTEQFSYALDRARNIVMRDQAKVLLVADELERLQQLTEQEFRNLMSAP